MTVDLPPKAANLAAHVGKKVAGKSEKWSGTVVKPVFRELGKIYEVRST